MLETIQLQKKLLRKLKSVYGKFKVASYNTSGYWDYNIYPSENASWYLEHDALSDRMIMKDEIVIESDLSMMQMNRGITRQHEKKLLENHIGFETWYSGNKSFHTHTTFPELLKLPLSECNTIKRLFILWLYDFDDKKCASHKIDMQLCSNHLIRLEYACHPMTGIRKRLTNEHELDVDNKLPVEVWLRYNEIKSKYKPAVYNNMSQKYCIKYLLSTPIEDGRHRVAFVLFKVLKNSKGVDDKYLIQYL